MKPNIAAAGAANEHMRFDFASAAAPASKTGAPEPTVSETRSIATIDGNLFSDDRQALMHLARELGFIIPGQNFGINTDALQEFLKVTIFKSIHS